MKLFKPVRIIWKKSNEDFLFTHAASLTYYSFIYFIPIFALFYFFFDYFRGFEQVTNSIQSFVGVYLAPQLADTILSYVLAIQKEVSAETVGIFGLIGFIVSSCLLLLKIEFSFNSMFGKTQHPHRIKRIAKYALLMTVGPIFIGLSILAQQAVYKITDGHVDITVLSILVSILPLITTVVFITTLFKWVSVVDLSWKTCFKAAMFTGIGIEVVKQLYAYYVIYSLNESVYGTIAVLPLFLIWINTIWTIILLGGQICCYVHVKEKKVRDAS